MINEIIELLPSVDLKERLKSTNHQFKESELLQIIYRYAPTFDTRIDMLERFICIASPEVSALAKMYIEHEKEKIKRFIESSEEFVYELHIKVTPRSYEEKYLCSSYNAALVCIDRFYEQYADIDTKETEKSRYKILKRKIFSEDDKFEEDTYGECVLGPKKIVLEVPSYDDPPECCLDNIMCSECKELCLLRCDELIFPCFASNHAILKYRDYEGNDCFGVNICCWHECNGVDSEFYVIPLDATVIREHHFNDVMDVFDAHQHIEFPLATLATPDDLDETTRKNYFDFVEFLNKQGL